MGQFRALDLGLGGSRAGQPTSSPLSAHHQGQLCSTLLARSPSATISKRQGQPLLLSCPWGWHTLTHTSRASSAVLPRQGWGPTLPNAAACEGLAHPCLCHEDLLHCVAPLRYRARPPECCSQGVGTASSPNLMPSGQVPPATTGKGGECIADTCHRIPPHDSQVAGPALPYPHHQGWLT